MAPDPGWSGRFFCAFATRGASEMAVAVKILGKLPGMVGYAGIANPVRCVFTTWKFREWLAF